MKNFFRFKLTKNCCYEDVGPLPFLSEVEKVVYRWVQKQSWISVLRDPKNFGEITLVFAEDMVLEEYLWRNVFPASWTPKKVQVDVTKNIIKITVKTFF